MNSLSELPQWYFMIWITLFGLCLGSFLNVVILRGLSGEPFVMTRSKCPKCGNQLRWYMNIPLFSYLFLRGKCGFCKEKISIQYPIIELLTAVLFLVSYLQFGLTFKTLFSCAICFMLIALATTDILETVIIDTHTYILFGITFLASIFNYFSIDWKYALITSLVAYFGFEAFSRIGYLILKQRFFGEGDSLILLSVAPLFGLKNLAIIFILSLIIQCFAILPSLILTTFKSNKKQLALSYLFTLFSLVATIIANFNQDFVNSKYYLIFIAIIVLILIFSLKNILKDIKEKRQEFANEIEKNSEVNEDELFEKSKKVFYMLPFGPALVASSLICLFYIDKVKEIIGYILNI